ncbi:hypothetical protein [Paenibacillus terrigena]|nr:hypothetical protein [Paenibacillus terrigena]
MRSDPYVDVIQCGMQRATTVLAEVRRSARFVQSRNQSLRCSAYGNRD